MILAVKCATLIAFAAGSLVLATMTWTNGFQSAGQIMTFAAATAGFAVSMVTLWRLGHVEAKVDGMAEAREVKITDLTGQLAASEKSEAHMSGRIEATITPIVAEPPKEKP